MLQFHSTCHLTFNDLFNIQLFTHYPLLIQCSTFYVIFNLLETSIFLVSYQRQPRFQGVIRFEKHQGGNGVLTTLMWRLTYQEFSWTLFLNIFINEMWKGELWSSISLLSIIRSSLLRSLRDSRSNIDAADKEILTSSRWSFVSF